MTEDNMEKWGPISLSADSFCLKRVNDVEEEKPATTEQ